MVWGVCGGGRFGRSWVEIIFGMFRLAAQLGPSDGGRNLIKSMIFCFFPKTALAGSDPQMTLKEQHVQNESKK